VEALHLARGRRRERSGEEVTDAILPADAVKEDLSAAGAEAAGEDLAIVEYGAMKRSKKRRESPSWVIP